MKGEVQTVDEITANLDRTLPMISNEPFILSPDDFGPLTSKKKQPYAQPRSQNPTYNRH